MKSPQEFEQEFDIENTYNFPRDEVYPFVKAIQQDALHSFKMSFAESQLADVRLAEIGARLAEIFNLKHDPDYPDRWLMEGGNKTNIGLARSFLRIAEEINKGVPGHKLFTS